MKYFVGGDGVYLGAFQGLEPEGGIEVDMPPEDGRQVWDGNQWGPIPVEVPQSVSRFQARAALHQSGKLAEVETAIAESDVITQMAWQGAQEFRRNSPTILALGDQLGLDLDALFIAAAQIQA